MVYVIASLLFVYLLGFVVLISVQERFIFLDDDLPQDHQFDADVPFDELFLEGPEQGRLNALHFKADSTKGLILYFHGNRGNLTRWGPIASQFTQYGYDVLVMDYRGFGKSTGTRNQQNLLADATLFYNWASERYTEQQIVLYGRSLGTGIASYLAQEQQPRLVILETPYYSLAKAAQRFYPIYPSKFALKYNFKSYEYLQKAACQVLIFHGTEDTVVLYEQGKALAESLANEKVEFVTIEGGEHRNLAQYPIYWETIERVLSNE